MLDNYFNYKKHNTDFKTEVIAGVTTFLTMAYIMFLNPFMKEICAPLLLEVTTGS